MERASNHRKQQNEIRVITAWEQGRRAWFVLKPTVSPPAYLAAFRKERVDIKDLGEILACGWGFPPVNIQQKYGA